LWTPGYWGWNTGYYWWYPGYWGRRVGFYGGINYGYGYSGRGYAGGYWRHGHLHYNRAVLNVNTDKSRFTYRKPVVRGAGVSVTTAARAELPCARPSSSRFGLTNVTSA